MKMHVLINININKVKPGIIPQCITVINNRYDKSVSIDFGYEVYQWCSNYLGKGMGYG